MSKKTFVEIGLDFDQHKWGLGVSTEIETANSEIRKKGFSKIAITEVYLRLWLLKKVLILSTKEGIKISNKKRKNFKVLIGVSDK
ncbi:MULTISPECIES: DUF3977 family protein [Vagococcus]|uniref:Uncharacterized protein n=1 Tax=Vagococcus fluvialis bH819 TaxID=1255619 RepID=A0A1X6WSC2_9ENTE|nr:MULTISPECIES: DUF3977 family protein [Vagococcus]SLM87251.1 hypothetical protein FM121_14215 [Vagococcus fluvialis bH819]HCM89083.1 DUF3977 domain-containing protein [Vagococcus sp.]